MELGGIHLVKTDNTIFVAWLCPFNIAFHSTVGLEIWAIFVLNFLCSFQSQTPSSNSYPMHCVLPTPHFCWLGLRVRGHFFKKGHVPVILSDIIQLFVGLGELLLTSNKRKVVLFFQVLSVPCLPHWVWQKELAFGSLPSHPSQSQAVLWPSATAA